MWNQMTKEQKIRDTQSRTHIFQTTVINIKQIISPETYVLHVEYFSTLNELHFQL